MSNNFRGVDREMLYLLPPLLQDWLPENHLARFVVELVHRSDLGVLENGMYLKNPRILKQIMSLLIPMIPNSDSTSLGLCVIAFRHVADQTGS